MKVVDTVCIAWKTLLPNFERSVITTRHKPGAIGIKVNSPHSGCVRLYTQTTYIYFSKNAMSRSYCRNCAKNTKSAHLNISVWIFISRMNGERTN